MGWVKGSALAKGDVVYGWFITATGVQGAYHHPFMVTKIEGQSITMRNCTSHTSASFTTIEITDADKVGVNHPDKWKKGSSSYYVTNGEMIVAPSAGTFENVIGYQPQLETRTYTQQIENEDGSMSFKQVTDSVVITQPVIIPVHSEVQYDLFGRVSANWISTNL